MSQKFMINENGDVFINYQFIEHEWRLYLIDSQKYMKMNQEKNDAFWMYLRKRQEEIHNYIFKELNNIRKELPPRSSRKKVSHKVKKLLARDGNFCGWCEEMIEENQRIAVDHIYPKSKGGPDDMSNLRVLHYSCNAQKSAKLFTTKREWVLAGR